jgi:hypothetical protein
VLDLLRTAPPESIQGHAALLERVHDVEGAHQFAVSVLGLNHGVGADALQQILEDSADLLVDQTGDALYSSSARKSADRGLCDANDVVSQDRPVAFRAALAHSLGSLSAP